MRFGLLISSLMHASLLLLVAFGLPFLRPPAPPTEAPILLELVDIGEVTTPQTPPAPEPKPVAKATDVKEAEPEPDKNETPLAPPPAAASAPPPPKLALAKAPVPPKIETPPPVPAPKPTDAAEPPPPPPLPKLEKKPPTPPKPPQLALATPAPETKPQAPEPPPQPETKPQAAKTPTPPVPKVPTPPEKKFEKTIDRIALLLDKSRTATPSQNPQAPRPQARAASTGPQATAGGREERQLTIREIDAIRLIIQRQIENCWDVPAGARDAADLAVKVSFSLNRDGTLASHPVVEGDVRTEAAGGPFYRAAAESARRAVLKCTPLAGLPPDSYEYWRDVTLNFNPREILGQ